MPKPTLMEAGHSDIFGTPPIATDIIIPYLDKDLPVWETAPGSNSSITKRLTEYGFKVIELDSNFLTAEPDEYCQIVTNPPYSIKDKFLKHCYELELPFALLLPITCLEGGYRHNLYRKYGLQLLMPNRRINFQTPSGQGSGSWFATAWFTYKLPLPKQLVFVKI